MSEGFPQSWRERGKARWRQLRLPVLFFTANRLALLALAYVGLVLSPGVYTERPLPKNLFLDGWFRWDSGWYRHIVEKGYTAIELAPGQRDIVFFPLYPLLVRYLGWITGDVYTAALIVSHLALLVATVLFYRLVARRWSEEAAQKSTLLLLCYPYSFYFSAMYTESLCLLWVVAAFYFAERKRWLWSGLAIAGCSSSSGWAGWAPSCSSFS